MVMFVVFVFLLHYILNLLEYVNAIYGSTYWWIRLSPVDDGASFRPACSIGLPSNVLYSSCTIIRNKCRWYSVCLALQAYFDSPVSAWMCAGGCAFRTTWWSWDYVFPEPVECTDWRSVPQRTMPPLFIQAPRLSRSQEPISEVLSRNKFILLKWPVNSWFLFS